MAEFFNVTNEDYHLFEPLVPEIYTMMRESDPGLFVVGAAENDQACGVLVCRSFDNTVSILYMAVSDEFQGKGIATGMVEYLCSAALNAEQAVFCDFSAATPYGDAVYGVLNATGMFSLDRQPGARYEGHISDLDSMMVGSDKLIKEVDFLSYGEAKATEKNQLQLILQKNDCDYRAEDMGQYLDDLSFIAFSKDKHQPVATIMVAKGSEEGALEIPFVWSYGKSPKEIFALIAHVADCLRQLAKKKRVPGAMGYGEDDVVIRISTVNDSSDALLNRLLPDFRPILYFYRAIYDMK